jgi:hypothetical protein
MKTEPEEPQNPDTNMTTTCPSAEPPPQPADWPRELDEHLRESALRFLRASGYRSLWALQCEVLDGIVTLSGMVSSFYLKQMAQALVLKLDAIKGVQNRIWVRED